jgi:tryptophan-rich sensory protein
MEPNFIFIPLIAILTASIGGAMTSKEVRTWYKTLKLPPWTPGGKVIGAVWTVLYFLAAISALIVWNGTPHSGNFGLITVMFIVNALVNISWTYIFFKKHRIYPAIWDALLLDVTVLVLIDLIAPRSPLAALLLMPYAAWVTFAAYLNYRIWRLNRRRLF